MQAPRVVRPLETDDARLVAVSYTHLYLLVLTKVMGNWWLVLATALIAIALPAVGRLVEPDAFLDPVKAAPGRTGLLAAPATAPPLVEGVADARP